MQALVHWYTNMTKPQRVFVYIVSVLLIPAYGLGLVPLALLIYIQLGNSTKPEATKWTAGRHGAANNALNRVEAQCIVATHMRHSIKDSLDLYAVSYDGVGPIEEEFITWAAALRRTEPATFGEVLIQAQAWLAKDGR